MKQEIWDPAILKDQLDLLAYWAQPDQLALLDLSELLNQLVDSVRKVQGTLVGLQEPLELRVLRARKG